MGIFSFIDLPYFRYRLRQSLADRKRTFDLEQWAEDRGMDIVAVQPYKKPPYSVVQQFPSMTIGIRHDSHYYFLIDTVDADHVRRSGVARVCHYEPTPVLNVNNGPWPLLGTGRVVDAVWFTTEQS